MLWHKTIGEGPNLVLLHGWAFNSDIFLELVNKYKKGIPKKKKSRVKRVE